MSWEGGKEKGAADGRNAQRSDLEPRRFRVERDAGRFVLCQVTRNKGEIGLLEGGQFQPQA